MHQPPVDQRERANAFEAVAFFGEGAVFWKVPPASGHPLRCEFGVQLGGGFQKSAKGRSITAILIAVLFHDARADKVLKFFVSPEAEHFLAAAALIPVAEIGVNDVEKGFELKRRFF